MGEPTLQELIRGKGAHADSLACVEDIPWQLAGETVAGYPHSISQILGHINYWIEYELKLVAGERPVYPEHAIESWPEVSSSNAEQWRAEVDRFASLLQKLMVLTNSKRETLDRQVEIVHASESSRTSTVRAVLWQLVVHNSYHLGQITMLRRCLGAWPGPGGGDTW
jgi:uncharacterized damage-inducible protein DinB